MFLLGLIKWGGYTASQATALNQPWINVNPRCGNQKSIYFDGTNDALISSSFHSFSGSQASVIFIGIPETGDTSQGLFEISKDTSINSGISCLYSTDSFSGRCLDTGGVKNTTGTVSLGSMSLLEVSLAGTSMSLYRNNAQVGTSTTFTTLNNAGTLNNIKIGTLGSGVASGFNFKGPCCEVIVANQPLTWIKRNVLYEYYLDRYTKKNTGVNLVIDGDSLSTYPDSSSSGVQLSYPGQWTGITAQAITNVAEGGMTLNTRNTAGSKDATHVVDSLYNSDASKNILVVWLGTNDLQAGADGAATYTRWETYINARITKGWKVVGLTSIQRTGAVDSARATFNTSVRAFANASFALADVALLGEFDSNGDEDDTDIYTDGTHLTTAGSALVATVVSTAVATL